MGLWSGYQQLPEGLSPIITLKNFHLQKSQDRASPEDGLEKAFGRFVKQLSLYWPSSKTSRGFYFNREMSPSSVQQKQICHHSLLQLFLKNFSDDQSDGLLHNHTLRHLPLGFCWRFFLFNSGDETPCSRLSGMVAILHDPNPPQLCPLEGETWPSVRTPPHPGGIIPNSVQFGSCQPFIISKICAGQ